MTLEEMKNVDIRTVDPETLVDVTKIVIDESLPKEEIICKKARFFNRNLNSSLDNIAERFHILLYEGSRGFRAGMLEYDRRRS